MKSIVQIFLCAAERFLANYIYEPASRALSVYYVTVPVSSASVKRVSSYGALLFKLHRYNFEAVSI